MSDGMVWWSEFVSDDDGTDVMRRELLSRASFLDFDFLSRVFQPQLWYLISILWVPESREKHSLTPDNRLNQRNGIDGEHASLVVVRRFASC